MHESIEFELRAAGDADAEQVQRDFREELAKSLPGAVIQRAEQIKPFGMTDAEIIINILISVGTSVGVHVYRDQIDAAAKAVGKLLKTDVRVIFGGKGASGASDPSAKVEESPQEDQGEL
jgi:hypothetical protein